jgi:hypothetical protein
MLCLSRQLGYIHEPFNPSRWPGWASEPFPHELVYINSDNEAKYDPILQDVINMRFPLMHHVWEIRDHLSPFAEELHRFKSRTDTDVIDQAGASLRDLRSTCP